MSEGALTVAPRPRVYRCCRPRCRKPLPADICRGIEAGEYNDEMECEACYEKGWEKKYAEGVGSFTPAD